MGGCFKLLPALGLEVVVLLLPRSELLSKSLLRLRREGTTDTRSFVSVHPAKRKKNNKLKNRGKKEERKSDTVKKDREVFVHTKTEGKLY